MDRKNDYIEMIEKNDNNKIHMTKEENRKIKPKEFKNVNFILNNHTHVARYTWEVEGEKIITKDKIFFTREEKKILKYMLLKKMPEKFRPNYWLTASGARREMLNNKDYYKNITEFFPDIIPCPYENQIEMDLHRTFPDDPFFKKEENIQKLRNILVAYSRRNISIGYCQGFNFIVGRLLKIFSNEEEAFWMFVQLIESILPINFYSELAGIIIDSSILIKLIKIYLPTLYLHLSDIGYELSLNNVLYKWFVSIYIQNLSLDLSLIIWDVLILEGNIVMFKSALGILKILKHKILSLDSMEELNYIFEDCTKYLNDTYTMIYYLILRRFEFDNSFITKNRIALHPAIVENINYGNQHKIQGNNSNYDQEDPNLRRRASYAKNSLECYKEWPLCIYDLNYKYNLVNFLIFRVMSPPQFITNYFFDYVNSSQNNSNTQNKNLKKHYSKFTKKRRKGSNSSEGFEKIEFENLSENEEKIIHLKSKSQKVTKNKKEISDDLFEFKMKMYSNLLLERRKHYCCETAEIKSCMDEFLTEEQLENDKKDNEDLVEVYVDNKYDIVESYVRLKGMTKTGEDNLKKTKRSWTMRKPSNFYFNKPQNDELSYCQMLNNLNNSHLSIENSQILNDFKPKPFIDGEIEDYYDQDDGEIGQTNMKK